MNQKLVKETINNKTFIKYRVSENDVIDQVSVEMLKNNKVSHILPLSYANINDEEFLTYDVTNLVALSEIIKKPVSKETIVSIINGICDGIMILEDYMIPNSSILTNLDEMFFDEYSREIYLICFPVNINFSESINMKGVIKSIMFSLQMKLGDEYISGGILNLLNMTQSFSFAEFKKGLVALVEKEKKTKIEPQKKETIVDKKMSDEGVTKEEKQQKNKDKPKEHVSNEEDNGMAIPSKNTGRKVEPPVDINIDPNEPQISFMYLMQHYNSENAAIYKRQKEARKAAKGKTVPSVSQKSSSVGMNIPNKQSNGYASSDISKSKKEYVEHREEKKRNFGDTTDLSRKGKKKTTVLSEQPMPSNMIDQYAIITRKRTGETITINRTPFSMGASEDGDVNFCIRGNTNISQSHLIIDFRNGSYYAIDDNSTNGTILNASRTLEAQVPVKLNTGDFLMLADEEFKFEIK